MKKSIAAIVSIGIFLSFAISNYLQQTPKSDFDLDTFGSLPVVMNGRVQPLDSVARNSLLAFSGKTVAKYEDGTRHRAIEWFAELTLAHGAAADRPVFRIYDEGIRDFLPKNEAPQPKNWFSALLTGKGSTEFYYSFRQLLPSYDRISKDAVEASKVDAKLRSRYQKAVIDLANNMVQFNALSQSLHHAETPSYTEELEAMEKILPKGIEAMQHQQKGEEYDQESFNALMSISQTYKNWEQTAPFFTHPHVKPDGELDWEKPAMAIGDIMKSGHPSEVTVHYAEMIDAYRQGQPEAFNRAVSALRDSLMAISPKPFSVSDSEQLFNYLSPFLVAKVGYILVLLLALFSWIAWAEPLNKAAFWTAGASLIVHTAGILFRMHIIGYAPVINLYSSAVFVGWVAVVLAMILEGVYKNGVGNFVASIIGFSTLMIAPYLGGKGDTLEMMKAVLDSNFWLSTHVVTVTMGYASTFLSGFLALVFILMGLLTNRIDKDMQKSLRGMVYGIICFSTLFSFVGTILGGIWADQSWGRFWGWDPKENGAILIVLWNAIILHARWGGFIKTRGLMAMAVFGNIVTAWSWMGTNMLGIGLHSYGFMSEAFYALIYFAIANLVVIGLAFLPPRLWRSEIAN